MNQLQELHVRDSKDPGALQKDTRSTKDLTESLGASRLPLERIKRIKTGKEASSQGNEKADHLSVAVGIGAEELQLLASTLKSGRCLT